MSYSGTIDAMLKDGRDWIRSHPGEELSFQESVFGDNDASRELAHVVSQHGPSMAQGIAVLRQLRNEYLRHWKEA